MRDAHDGQRVLRAASDLLKERFKIYFSTIQIEGGRLAGERGAEAIDVTRSQSYAGHSG